jgi:hypothetical protein
LPKSWRRFSPDRDLQTDEARDRWRVDQQLYRASRRASRYAENLWESPLVDDGGDERRDWTDPRDWASAVGVKKADSLLAQKLGRRRVEARVERYLNRHRTPSEDALAVLAPATRRATTTDRRTPEFWVTLPQQLAVDLARREPEAYALLADFEADGALELPMSVVSALERALERLTGSGVSRTFGDDLRAILRGRSGDGQRVIDAAAAIGNGVRVTTFRKKRAISLRRR